jgi:ribulose-5-phosphate 4-epimerase/fuculose-1-phosphate aldolase
MSEYVKFTYERAVSELAPFAGVVELNACRQKLLERRLIGVDSSGTSFGNISIRDGVTNNFHITGSGTGGIQELMLSDCAKVVAYDFERNWLRYEGSTILSSESLTHAAIYKADSRAVAVIHCHDSALWVALLDEAPTTSNAIAYGTPEMAYETMRLFRVTDVQTRKILVMAGHKGGIAVFGGNLEEAFAVLVHERNGIVSMR